MDAHDQLRVGARWQDVIPALLPGLVLVAQKSGMLQRLGNLSFVAADMYAVPVLCLALVLVSLLRERRFAVWSYPALGTVLAIGLLWFIGATSALAQSFPWAYPAVTLVLGAIVWGAMLILSVRYHIGSAAPKEFWLLFAALIGVDVLLYGMDILGQTGGQVAEALMIASATGAMWLGLRLLPVLIVWRLGQEQGTMAALVVLAAEFLYLDSIFDSGYAISMWTRDGTVVWLVHNLPAIGFLLISPLWVLSARSFQSRAIGFLLPPSVVLVATELLAGAVRPYYTPAMWLRRGLGASEFVLILALAIVAYDAIQIGRVRSEHSVRPAEAQA